MESWKKSKEAEEWRKLIKQRHPDLTEKEVEAIVVYFGRYMEKKKS